MFEKVIACVLFLSLAGCGSDGAEPTRELHQIFEDEWEFRLQEDPLFATSVGVHDFNDRLPEVNEAAQQRRARFQEELLARLDGIDVDHPHDQPTPQRLDHVPVPDRKPDSPTRHAKRLRKRKELDHRVAQRVRLRDHQRHRAVVEINLRVRRVVCHNHIVL